jgi:hypothetical protein
MFSLVKKINFDLKEAIKLEIERKHSIGANNIFEGINIL